MPHAMRVRRRSLASPGADEVSRPRRLPGPRPRPAPPTRQASSARAVGGLTSRAVVLALVLCALLLMLAYPLREFLAQRSQIEAARTTVAQQKERVVALEAEKKRWGDPAYVRAQARTRLHFVMPGETQYVVLDPGEPRTRTTPTAGAHDRPALSALDPSRVRLDTTTADTKASRPWFARLWRSAQSAAGS